ncbi:MAG: tripartite tricarboxylate transporter substrate-binding protein [Deltaproteobacteria bacterium]|nr:tripartite tricarboxylate transporter substrate-binding protein [Deltaproteobacteria bacterium]
MCKRFSCLTIVLVGFIFVLTASSPTWASSHFYKGKSIRFIIGMGPGGGFDLYGRLLARHMGRYIPGHPQVIVQNIPGAGSLAAANLVYQKQPGDGLTMVMLHYGVVTQAIAGSPLAKFDPRKYIWIGDPTIGGLPQVLWMRTDLPVRSVDDLKKAKKPWRLASTGVGVTSGMVAEFLKLIGFPVKLVLGYKSSSNIMLALERKEVDGYSISQATMQQVFRRYLDEGILRPILSIGKDPRLKPLPGVTALEDLKLSPEQRKLAKFFTTGAALLRVHAVPPGTPTEQVRILREAFLKVLKDPRLLEEARRMKVVISPTSGQEITQLVEALTQASPETVKNYKKLIGLK